MQSDKVRAARAILKALAIGAVLPVALVAPNAIQILEPLIAPKKSKLTFNRGQISSGLNYAKAQGWLEVRQVGEQVEIRLTKHGRHYWQKLELNRPLTAARWDGRWRILIFDIPNRKNNPRHVLRTTLKALGFVMIQRSVWVTPYPCQNEITAVRQLYGLNSSVLLFEASKIEGENNLRRIFNLKPVK